jgi:hypothetical protein
VNVWRLDTIDLIVLLGIGVVLPLALGGRAWWWVLAAGSASVAFSLPPGWPAAALVLPFGATAAAIVLGLGRVRRPARAGMLAAGYALVAAGALAQSRAGITVLGIEEPYVELTAVHFIYAGAAALTLALRSRGVAPDDPRGAAVGKIAVVLVAVAPLEVASGFVGGGFLALIFGAILMALGACTVGALQVRRAARDHGLSPARRVLLGVSGLAVWAPMALAIYWPLSLVHGLTAVPIDVMVRTHGLANSLAFCLCGLLATRPPDGRTLRGADGQPEGGHPWTSTSTTTASPAGST